nr:galactose-3-O-sulfotransferase 4-like [Dermacentor andersoni]
MQQILRDTLFRQAALLHRPRLALLIASILLLLGFVMEPILHTGLRLLPVPAGKMLQCSMERQRSVCFVKTHKCASSSVQNMLMRYGESHGLRFVLPKRPNYLGHPSLFHPSMAPAWPPFDMLVHHARFHETEMRAVLRQRPFFVTIVREPAALFESLYSYYTLKRKTNMSLEQFSSAALANRSVMGLLGRTRSQQGFNQMSFDLGMAPAQFGNAFSVRRFVEQLDATFDLVMVAERINESLVLLKDLLCWDTDDIVVFKHNARQVLVFRVKNESSEECVRMTLPELVYTERLRKKQFGNTMARRPWRRPLSLQMGR